MGNVPGREHRCLGPRFFIPIRAILALGPGFPHYQRKNRGCLEPRFRNLHLSARSITVLADRQVILAAVIW